MANPGGTNQFQGFATDLPYGEKQRQGMLERIAPKAGQAQATAALEAPRRAGRRARTGNAEATPAPPPVGTVEQLSPAASSQALVDEIGRVPGLTPVWGQLG